MANVQNLASGTLTSSISASTTSLSVYVGEGSSFVIETIWPATPFYATIMPAVPNAGVANSLDSEIVKVTAVSNLNGNVILTVTRGQRGTSGKAFSEGDIVTAAVYADDAVLLGEESTSETPTPWVETSMIENGAVTPEKASFTTYSTTETRVGTWIDGKPLYRKVVQFTSPADTYTFTQVATGIANADYAFIENGAIKNTAEGWSIQINSARGTSDNNMMNWAVAAWVRLQPNATNFAVSVAGGLNNQPMWVSVLYTKTTD